MLAQLLVPKMLFQQDLWPSTVPLPLSVSFALSPSAHLIQYAAIQLDHFAIDVSALRQENHSHAHLLITACAPCGDFMALVLDLLVWHPRLVTLIGLLHGHLAWEVTWRDAVHANARLGEFLAHHT